MKYAPGRMKPSWMQRHYIQLALAARGRGITLPWIGKNQKKRQAVIAAYYGDDGAPSGWRGYWRSKHLAKLNNRDDRRMGGIE